MKVLLIAGGWSTERDVSLASARNIGTALDELGHDVTFLDLLDGFGTLVRLARENDFAFLALHGAPGEDGLVQAVLESAGCPYQGSGPAASFLALNKAASKALFREADLRTPDWELIPRPGTGTPLQLRYPVFVKPNMGGSSLGMSLVEREVDLPPALEKVHALGEEALVEAAVPGVEVTCGILGETPQPLILIRPKHGSAYFDYQNKYDQDGADEICPAPVDEELVREVQHISLEAHRILGCRGYSRADFMVQEGVPYLLEVNTLPGMTSTSLLPRSAKVTGLDFNALIAELIRLGMEHN
ncbi:D-alanine-D-alanine ligase [Paucidesulfovibrio gracilis DSM 16080]|uniref:D-alanine--D-alanine ligase n=1 Tax=Paucidesulfovibrio gracilis DSM 16080 TaxID=1121449 RepID=A0A1T4WBE9_9BACT|nr:D-alanine--D-alanine ligase [Paucidesulfovibrio gracilis]SKA74600.1 D-alanine-D-alanine ligase [Paucidesulfovibrio gracilis DSM 16080]